MDNMINSSANEAKKEEKKLKKKPFEKKMAIPTKTQINFAFVGLVPMKLSVLIPGVVLIIIGAALLSKFFVVDRILEVSRLQSELSTLQGQIEAEQAAIDEMGDIATQYAHYTWSGMTPEEIALTERMQAVALIKKYILSEAKVGSYTISGNEISLPITGADFKKIGRIVSKLEDDPLVDHCEVIAATSEDSRIILDAQGSELSEPGGELEATAQVTIYLADTGREVQQ